MKTWGWILVVTAILILIAAIVLLWIYVIQPMIDGGKSGGLGQSYSAAAAALPAFAVPFVKGAATTTGVPPSKIQPTSEGASMMEKYGMASAPTQTISENPALAKANPVFAKWNVGQFLPQPGQPGTLGPDAPTWEELTAGRELISNPNAYLQASAAARGFLVPPTVKPKWKGTDTRPFPAIKQIPVAFGNPGGVTEADLKGWNAGAADFYCNSS